MTISRIAFRVGIGAVVASCLGATVYAASSHTNAQYSATPVGVQAPVSPMVMLTMTKGHMLWREAYNSYTDLNNDGDYETTYDHSINYYGYFEPDRCYTYSSGEFVPSTSISSDKYCSGAFSGNFMNWATMTRIDILRKLLYGGSRDVDSSTKTTLKRALLPNDAHSFAKHYNGSDIDKLTPYSGISVGDEAYHGITICNTTPPTDGGRSHTSVKNPQARFIEGNFSMWGASERSNCVYKDEYAYLYDTYNFGSNGNVPKLTYNKAYDDKPEEINGSNVLGNLDVIVKACPEARVDDELGVHCKQYGTSIKPIGLLQEYGEDGLIEFGLMSGSYLKNTSGGVLRKNIGSMADEINLANGTFISPPDDLGIVNAIERMRIFGYNYGSNYNNPNAEEHGMTYSWDWGSQCNWGRNSITDGVCHSWGDPFAEMFMESLRYFAGLSPTGDFYSDDTQAWWQAGTTNNPKWTNAPRTSSWDQPLNNDNWCAPLNIVGLSGGEHSFDHDSLDGFNEITAGSETARSTTKLVGDYEKITGDGSKKFIVGETGSSSDEQCTPKTVNNFGDVRGVCPTAPTKEGTYRLAGMAHYAHTKDINASVINDQKVTTYGIDFGGDAPVIEIPTPNGDRVVRITPAYRNQTTNGSGALVDFFISQEHTLASDGNSASGHYVAVWEDGEFGGDYDYDIMGYIHYEIDNNEITVWTGMINESVEGTHLFGFTIAGTEHDGFHAYSGVNAAPMSGNASHDAGNVVKQCGNPDDGENVNKSNDVDSAGCWTNQYNEGFEPPVYNSGDQRAMRHTFSIEDEAAQNLESPLYYAAKYGGFYDDADDDGNGLIDEQSDWDKINNLTGADGQDGIPDNYFSIKNPLQLVESLRDVLETIRREAAGAAEVSIGVSNFNGNGAVFHAFYESEREGINTSTGAKDIVTWLGHLNAMWIDKQGYFREDTNNDGALGSYTEDLVIDILVDNDTPRIFRQTSSTPDKFTKLSTEVVDLDDLKPLWSAVNKLAEYEDSDLKANRGYTENAENGRYIFTGKPTVGQNFINNSSVAAFDKSLATSDFSLLNVDSATEAEEVINYIRGVDQAGKRSRTLDNKTYRLGDIINSGPVLVGKPAEDFDRLYGDLSYFDYVTYHQNRRNVVYVGANDGMLHAFNAGFLSAGNEITTYKKNLAGVPGTAHDLGDELWAYVPSNVLPQLKWLADANYEHVFYVDGSIRVFDAQIFTPDTTHVNGWGTVLVAGLRLGGAPMTIDTDPSAAEKNHTFRSSYVVMDVTNPEMPPVLLGEITDPKLGMTTSEPAVVHVEGDSGADAWYLVFGSGPIDSEANVNDILSKASSNQKAQIFAWDLVTRSSVLKSKEIDEGNSHAAHPIVVDWDLNKKANALYIGTTSRIDSESRSGNLYKINIKEDTDFDEWSSPMLFAETKGSVSARPTVGLGNGNRHWVFTGTGRLMVPEDMQSTGQEYMYGFIDTEDSDDYPIKTTTDVTDASVVKEGEGTDALYKVSGISGIDDNSMIGELLQYVVSNKGWHRRLNIYTDAASERAYHPSPLVGGVIFTAAYQPQTTMCTDGGKTRLFGVCYETGTACATANVFMSDDINDIFIEIDSRTSAPAVFTKSNEDDLDSCGTSTGSSSVGAVKLIANSSVGELVTEDACTGGPINSGETSWREVLE